MEAARELDLGSYLKLGRGEDAAGGRRRPSIQADAMEALIAAVYLDGGMGPVRKVIQRYILSRELDSIARPLDHKTTLQELVQRESGQVLQYRLVGEEGPDHAKLFYMEVVLNGVPIGSGSGHTKKEAEQKAACAAIQTLTAE